MKLPSTIRFANPSIKQAFYGLENGNAEEKELFNAIKKAFVSIKENAFCGTQIPKALIPKQYIQDYGIKNLWKYDLHGGWRLTYSIRTEGVIIISLIIEYFSHKEYERRFNY